METEEQNNVSTFRNLGLSEQLTGTLDELGYESPTPIQEQTIPLLLAGHDVIGQAQTGTGKTAAFALPILERIDLAWTGVQAIVLTPTRELAIQVSEAFHTYARKMSRLRVMPIYGGDSIQKQIGRLKGGIHVVVGTPGRVMDHLRRGTLTTDAIRMIVLDEADEMLNMGFLEDVEWILEQAPEERQMALFSATMPPAIQEIANRHLKNPVTVHLRHKTLTVPTIDQMYIHVSEKQKLDVLTRLLEIESAPGESILIFVRTKVGAAEVSEKLQARGYAAEAMHGDMGQVQRESVIRRMRSGQVEIVVATDVAARGLDVEQIVHVINYDMPYDPEAYVHRIGRTGRAGRTGKATLFATPREGRMLREIERFTRQKLTPVKVPSAADVAARRLALFKERVVKTMEEEDLELYLTVIEDLTEESGHDLAEIAAALARIAQGDNPLVAPVEQEVVQVGIEKGMVRLYIDAGRKNGVSPSDVVRTIASESEVPGHVLGAIDIFDYYTFVDVPARFKDQVLRGMEGASIRRRDVNMRLASSDEVEQHPAEGARGRKKRYDPTLLTTPRKPFGLHKGKKAKKMGKKRS